jgi:hypothetical protein
MTFEEAFIALLKKHGIDYERNSFRSVRRTAMRRGGTE